MLNSLVRGYHRFFGTGEADTSVPVFDGPLKPNNRLETAEIFLERAGLDDLCVTPAGDLFASAGAALLRIDRAGAAEEIARLPQAIQALVAYRDGLAVATRAGLHFIGGRLDGRTVRAEDGLSARCINALCESPEGTLLVSDGSAATDYADWSRDLLRRERSGRLLEYAPESGECRVRLQGLAYCYGVCAHAGRVFVSESWAHRLRIVGEGEPQAGPGELPGYPSRIVPASGGGFWLTVFAPRSQLLEFVLREDAYRQEMVRTIEPRYWIAPALGSGQDFLEPLQQGGVRQMGILKPWAPPRSYGLVVRLDEHLSPRHSVHSRVGGHHHGITAAAEFDGALLALSKGAGRLVRIPLSEIEK